MSNRKPTRNLIVPIFIPNQGCPHRCIFCQQEKITAQSSQTIDASIVNQVIQNAIDSERFKTRTRREVAFYGGTFTGLPLKRMKELLGTVSPYLKEGVFTSIRVSTRPDALDENRLEIMRSAGVSTVELGVQSMDNRVLEISQRGHSAQDTVEAVTQLRRYGFNVGIQLMPGLPGDSEENFLKTVDEVVKLGPDMVRLYPAVVIRGTELARWYREKRYVPLDLEEAVRICRESCEHVEREGIPVIRIGLMSTPSLLREGEIIAGPWHESFGFLVRSSIHQKRIEPYLTGQGEFSQIRIRVPSREIPLVRGYKNLGVRWIERKTGAMVVGVIPDGSVPLGQIAIDNVST
ncbi:MAG: radical SAM protein [Pseudomonadota bacterium]